MKKTKMTMEELKSSLRLLKYYTYRKSKGVTEHTIICCDENVDELFEKYRKRSNTTIEIGKYQGLCDDCQLTACWDRCKAIRCNIKKVKQK